jgi:DNA gyrase/topoisomerase IV subunit A
MLTIIQYIEKYGAKKTAIQLINQRLRRLTGLTLPDFPDTLAIHQIIDSLEQILIDNPNDKESIKTELSAINDELIMSTLLD